MYLPRHYKQDKKKPTNYPLIIFIILGIILLAGIQYKWKDLTTYFSGNSRQKISGLEEQINDSLNNGKYPKNLISEYKSITNLYFESAPVDPTANYLISKTYFYLLLDRVKFDISELVEITSFDRKKNNLKHFQIEEDIEAMYRTALRANAFNSNFDESESNKVLIYLYELMANQKNPQILLGELSLVDANKINKDIEKAFIWMNIVTSALSGNVESLEIKITQNEGLLDRKINLQERNISFLKGIAFYNNNDFVKSLNALRESKLGYDLITIEATKFEAMIFFKQNLPEKAISLLETLYEETGSQDNKIYDLIMEILKSKPGLKTKVKVSE